MSDHVTQPVTLGDLSQKMDVMSNRIDGMSGQIDNVSKRMDHMTVRIDGIAEVLGDFRIETARHFERTDANMKFLTGLKMPGIDISQNSV